MVLKKMVLDCCEGLKDNRIGTIEALENPTFVGDSQVIHRFNMHHTLG